MKTGLRSLAVLLLVVAAARGQSFETRHRQLAAEVVKSAGGLAFWCQSNGLAGERARLYRGVLLWDPGAARARRSLGFTKQR
ncbi:MAG: hypothetical protein VX913_01395, partial [Planctomycetota bacterium]|nr:hypothetical protein [Planctomycetota bacterium]